MDCSSPSPCRLCPPQWYWSVQRLVHTSPRAVYLDVEALDVPGMYRHQVCNRDSNPLGDKGSLPLRLVAGDDEDQDPAPVSAPKAAEGRPSSGGLSLQLEQVSFLSARGGAGPTCFEALLEEESSRDDRAPPQLPQMQSQVSLKDADEPVEEKDCCILSQDFFCTPDYITPEIPHPANGYEPNKSLLVMWV